MLTEQHVVAIKAFVTMDAEHVYGHCIIYKQEGGMLNILGTAPINSTDQEVPEYFLSTDGKNDTICGHLYSMVGSIQLTKGANTLTIKTTT